MRERSDKITSRAGGGGRGGRSARIGEPPEKIFPPDGRLQLATCVRATHRSEVDTCDTWIDKFDGPAILTFPSQLSCKLDLSTRKYYIYVYYIIFVLYVLMLYHICIIFVSMLYICM